MIRPSTTLARRADVDEEQVHGDLLVFSTPLMAVIALNGTAAAVWAELAEPLTFRELATRISRKYGVDRSNIVPSIARLIDEFHRLELVTVDGQG